MKTKPNKKPIGNHGGISTLERETLATTSTSPPKKTHHNHHQQQLSKVT